MGDTPAQEALLREWEERGLTVEQVQDEARALVRRYAGWAGR